MLRQISSPDPTDSSRRTGFRPSAARSHGSTLQLLSRSSTTCLLIIHSAAEEDPGASSPNAGCLCPGCFLMLTDSRRSADEQLLPVLQSTPLLPPTLRHQSVPNDVTFDPS
ncbi:hypothetical protein F7725_010984 [Dissostichus mawsoni]|uniref:Uncharacterized protein n=1 Tax=Dissostichus mawsoni TaxID=36200 RepID=A0A7J5Z8A7_DISMA|nr:hypothetical protein F7725_010984 [Dissostichus mawsoni]